MAKVGAVAIGAAALVGLAAAVLLQHQQISRLRREAEARRQEAVQVAELRRENERLSQADAQAARSLSGDERNELLRLRSEVTRLRQQVKGLTAASSRPQPPVTAPPPPAAGAAADRAAGGTVSDGFLPAELWADVGFGTPEAAFQTMHWAMRHGDQERMKQALFVPAGALPEGAEPVGVDMIAVPADGPSGAMLSTGAVPSDQAVTMPLPELTGSRIVSRQDVSPAEVRLTVENQHADGTRLSAQMNFRRVGSEWKLAPPAPAPIPQTPR
jgi:hypothetical protein